MGQGRKRERGGKRGRRKWEENRGVQVHVQKRIVKKRLGRETIEGGRVVGEEVYRRKG